jgi:hypothetical protein
VVAASGSEHTPSGERSADTLQAETMKLPRLLATLTVTVTALGCGGDDDPKVCGDTRAETKVSHKIYYGTSDPTFAPLSQGQVQAIGAWVTPESGFVCSGTLITPTFVLTADHCKLDTRAQFCFGDDVSAARCLDVKAVHTRPTVAVDNTGYELDLAVVELDEDATVAVPGVVPIPIVVEPLTGLEGHRVETSGYGRTERRTYGVRLFALERIDQVGPTDEPEGDGPAFVRVDGGGARGVCAGDSGGPALVIDSAGAVRVAGALSYGDDSCVDKDRYTRADVAREWIESFTGPTPDATRAGCGPIDAVGTCSGSQALHCDDAALVVDTCEGACGWDAAASGYRCITSEDPCEGQDGEGTCGYGIARWCENGVAKSLDCGCLDQRCVVDATVGARCR